MRKGWAAVSDFDGTITLKDVGDHLLLHYGFADRKTIEESYAPGVRIEDYMRRVYGKAPLTAGLISDFVLRRVEARRGFREFALFCERSGVPFEIASGGIDLYADPFFRKHRVKVRSFFGRGRFTRQGIALNYPFLRRSTLSAFKASRVARFRRLGYRVVFFGDAPNDFKAAALADRTYAAGRLLRLCREKGVPAARLTDFTLAARHIQRDLRCTR